MNLKLICTLAILVSAITTRADGEKPKLPAPPYRLMYGYKDYADFKPKGVWPDEAQWNQRWSEVFQHFNIITGRTADAGIVTRLRSEGKVFAYHLSNNRDAKHKTTEDFVNEWCKPFEETLGGQLPGGFDAISVDELHGDTDGSADSEITIRAIREVRRRYPRKLIITWAPTVVGLSGSPGINGRKYAKGKILDNQFKAVAECCDLIMLECYQRESSKHLDWFGEIAKNLQTRAPALLPKMIFGLCISQLDNLQMDDKPDVDFGDHIEKQLKMLRDDPLLKQTNGVAFYAFYRAKPELIPTVNRLVDQYYPGTPH